MGFSLKVFFEDLQFILAKDIKPKQKIAELDKLVADMRRYAKECGHIDG